MPGYVLTPSARVVELRNQGIHLKDIAQQTGISLRQVQRHLARAAELGLLDRRPVMPGFKISKTTVRLDRNGDVAGEYVSQKPDHGEVFEIPKGQVVKGVSAFIDRDGREIAKWVKTKLGETSPEEIADVLKKAFDGYQGSHVPTPGPAIVDEDLLTLFPIADWHVGMFSWGRETGNDWDLQIAERVIGSAVDEVFQRTAPSGTAVVLGGGDLMHADSQENRTARSGNQLDVDGRYQKVMGVSGRMMVRTIDAALGKARHVIVRVLKGNHDEHASIAIGYFLLAWYRNDPRVTVDVDPSLFWWHRFGKVMLGATHGHTVKIKDMPGIMAHRRAADWGQTVHRFVHGFHLHHKQQIATEGGGCVCEIHQAPIPQDAWHYGAGFLSGRSVQTITYHREFGEFSRSRVAILDGASKQAA